MHQGVGAQAVQPTGQSADAAPPSATSDFRLGALGLSASWRPEFAGAARSTWGYTPNLMLQWGRLTLSNGGTLASRAGEPTEAGLAADLFSRDRLSLRAAVNLEQGRKSQEIERLRGLHDIPAHLRGRVQATWRLHPRWELIGVWRGDLTDRGTGTGAEVVILHEWRPEFLDQRRWRISGGVAAQWRDARQANLLHGVTDEDAARTAFAAYRLKAGFTDARAFANWRRELDGPWVAYGALTYESLLNEAAISPIVQRPRALSLSIGLGRRF
jgi:outer membrane scaffolding protein for murein synthesis (MipA/OmpV family)